jgi:hypothetical protein
VSDLLKKSEMTEEDIKLRYIRQPPKTPKSRLATEAKAEFTFR